MAVDFGSLWDKVYRLSDNGNLRAAKDAVQICKDYAREGAVLVNAGKGGELVEVRDPENEAKAIEWAKMLRSAASRNVKEGGGAEWLDIYRDTLLVAAKKDFDSFCQFIEWERPPRRKFYEPRRPQLLDLTRSLDHLDKGDLDLLAISLAPGVGKSALGIFYICWQAGLYPEDQILIGSHNVNFIKGVYEEILRIMDPRGEYLWSHVFDEGGVTWTNAKDYRINLGKRKRFDTIQMTTINKGNAGLYRATRLLFCDDLVSGTEEAFSRERMDKLWQTYTTDLRQRKIGSTESGDGSGASCRELHIATRWSINDVLGRLERQNANNPRAKFINRPVMDADGHSLFNYPYGLGYSDAMLKDIQKLMEPGMFSALYLGVPIEREGQLYHPQELRRYYELPEGDPDDIIAVCDTKNAGTDYYVLLIAYQYGTDYYLDKIICDNRTAEVVEPKIVTELVDRGVRKAQFESNAAGGRIADNIQKMVQEKGGITRITKKWNQAHKDTRIVVNSAYAKEKFLFKDESVYENDPDYQSAMRQLFAYSMVAKNKYDDMPDAVAMLVEYLNSSQTNIAQLGKRFF